MKQDNGKHIKVDNHIFMQEITRQFCEEGRTSVTFTVYGNSMHPFLNSGRDKVVLVPPLPPRKGDVILAEILPRTYALHRVTEIAGDTVTMRGDGNYINSVERFTTDKIVGTATAFIRKGRYVSTNSFRWRAYSAVWQFLTPVRRYLLAFYRRIILKF